jgi:Arc/MetJ-type ribon-helix-helix transcriptional regulator
MNISLPPDLTRQVENELASGHYRNTNQLIEEAVRFFLTERERGQRRLDSLRRIGQAVDEAGLYEKVLVPGRE